MAKEFSNRYIFLYVSVLVILVVLLLTGVTLGLKPRQEANRAADRAMQILLAAGYRDIDAADAGALFDRVAHAEAGEEYTIRCADGTVGHVVRLDGKGLWGAIWGYAVLSADSTTLKGVTFGHKSETPGLGANISEEKFTSQFAGKSLYDADGNFTSVRVLPRGKEPAVAVANRVDAVSGATLTSRGVDQMLRNGLPHSH